MYIYIYIYIKKYIYRNIYIYIFKETCIYIYVRIVMYIHICLNWGKPTRVCSCHTGCPILLALCHIKAKSFVNYNICLHCDTIYIYIYIYTDAD